MTAPFIMKKEIKSQEIISFATIQLFEGAERKVFSCDAGFGQCIEQRGFTYVSYAYNTTIKSHVMLLLI